VKYPQAFELPNDVAVRALIDASLEAGINLIDTAPAYGTSEERLGSFLEASRDHIILCTKCGENYEQARSTWDFSAPAIERSLDRSLRRLKTDHVEILLLHSNGQDIEILTRTDALAALERAKQSGKARAIGISAKTETGILEACRSLDVVMAPFSQADASLGPALFKAHQAGAGILAIKGLASGGLAAAPALEFVLRQPFIDALIVGTVAPEHLRQAVAAAERIHV
jgi:aryl-alcohol dehydrogenase-like predicted oxidoreductase